MTAMGTIGGLYEGERGPGARMGLADQRTTLHRARGGSEADCPGWQENGAKVQEKVAPRRAGIRPTLPFTLSGAVHGET